jgi:hypothetical protein
MAKKSLDFQLAMDEQQLEQRRAMNDQLFTPREVDHFAYFRKRANAEQAAELLRADGFRVELARKGFTTSLAAHVDSPVDPDSVRTLVTRVFTIVESTGGDYDGWGGPVVPA